MRVLPQIGPADLSFPQGEMQMITWHQLLGKTPAYSSLGVHELCDELHESSCGSAGCSATAGPDVLEGHLRCTDWPTPNDNLHIPSASPR